MKHLLLIFILPAVIIYLFGSFIVVSFDINQWIVEGRAFGAFIYVVIVLILIGVKYQKEIL